PRSARCRLRSLRLTSHSPCRRRDWNLRRKPAVTPTSLIPTGSPRTSHSPASPPLQYADGRCKTLRKLLVMPCDGFERVRQRNIPGDFVEFWNRAAGLVTRR